MSKFLHYDIETNKIKGFFSIEIHGENIPEPNIEISDTLWQEILSNSSDSYRVEDDEVVPYIKPINERIEAITNQKISLIKQIASNTITTKYPVYKQQNLTNDSEIAKYSIQQLEEAYGNNINIETIIKNITFFVGLDYTIESLTNIEENINTIDISSLTQNTHQDILIRVSNYYKQIILSYVAYRKIEAVRLWSDNKEMEILDILNQSISDEEKLQALENFDTNINIVL